jgi:DNA mismatch endonuclease (patch repair protein)
MADIVDTETRSRMMSGIKGKNTKPEMWARKALTSHGYRYRLHRKDLPGAPDIVMPGRKVAIFVHGCFWHMHKECALAKLPGTRPEFWATKLAGNATRDEKSIAALREKGWRVLVVWECATRGLAVQAVLAKKLTEWIESDMPVGEISASLPTENR